MEHTSSPSRRAVVRGAAWTAPVLAVAAPVPAFAASGCGQRLDWDSFAANAQPPSSIVVSGVTITRSYAAVAGGLISANNDRVFAGPRGGVSQNALGLVLDAPTTGAGLRLTLGFAPAVYDLRFTLFDIDRVATGGWQDRVTPSAGFAASGQGANVTRTGDTFTATTNVNIANTDPAGNVTLAYAGPVSSLTLTYVDGDAIGGTNMAVFLSDLTFCLNP